MAGNRIHALIVAMASLLGCGGCDRPAPAPAIWPRLPLTSAAPPAAPPPPPTAGPSPPAASPPSPTPEKASALSIATAMVGANTALLTLKGPFDARTFEEVEKAIHALTEAKVFRIAMDLSAVLYISSAGAGVLIGAIGTLQENGGDLVLVNPSANVKEVLDLLGLSSIFPIATSRDEALKKFPAAE